MGKLVISHGKKLYKSYECNVHCLNIAINSANNLMTAYVKALIFPKVETRDGGKCPFSQTKAMPTMR
jgi:hypothetical protein